MQNKQQPENTPSAEYNTRQSPAAPAKPGERAADLIYSEAHKDIGGVWIYPASYDDFVLAYRRANSLSRGFGVPFAANLLLARPNDDAVSEPGYYAYTRADPRPFVLHIIPRPFVLPVDPSNAASDEASSEEAGR